MTFNIHVRKYWPNKEAMNTNTKIFICWHVDGVHFTMNDNIASFVSINYLFVIIAFID